MSFPCSLFKFASRTCNISANYVKYNFIYISSKVEQSKKYIIKKLTRDLQKTMKVKYDSNLLSPPECIRGMKNFDKSVFKKEIQIPVIFLDNAVISQVMPHLRKYFLKMENLKTIQNEIRKSEDKDLEIKYVLLNPLFVQNWSDISEEDRSGLILSGISHEQFKIIPFTLNYDNWKADELLRCILPEDKDSVAGFSKIGHIIHLNLRDHVLEYKEIIGTILLNKIAGTRTVINKLDKIDNTYRFFEMEILCGDKDTTVQVKENHCTFDFDFSAVYWNPRLATEHERIVNFLKPGDIFYDVFAGVGPFSIPPAKKKCFVYANDLNPESYKWLNYNAKNNKIKDEYIKTFNKDGRDFILNDLKIDLKNRFQNNNTNKIYIVMNLPALAPEFLPCFINLFSKSELESIDIKIFPKVFVYCFAKGEEPVTIARELVETHLGCNLPENYEIFNVRKVSNFKEMMRVSFDLNYDILCNSKKRRAEDDGISTEIKKRRAMGKNKGKQVKNVFKVAGAKSLKLKTKAKIVNTQLKKLNNITKERVLENNKQLAQLEDAVRQTTQVVKKEERTVNIKENVAESQKRKNEFQELSDKNLQEMESMKMT